MAHKKAGGSAKNLRDSNPKYLGTKLYSGETAKTGSVIVRQRGTKIMPGEKCRCRKRPYSICPEERKSEFPQQKKTPF